MGLSIQSSISWLLYKVFTLICLLCSMLHARSQRSLLRTLCRTARSILSQRLGEEREGAALPPQQWD